MLERIYVEIGNICNLCCSFCSGTKRLPRQMSVEEFAVICEKLRSRVGFVYLHVLGEPLCHPALGSFLELMKKAGMRAVITTNGTLLYKRAELLLSYAEVIHKINISLHAPEGSGMGSELDEYIACCSDFAKAAADKGIYAVMRLWNLDSSEGLGANEENEGIERRLKIHFGGEWQKRPRGYRLSRNVFLEYDGLFTWPAKSTAEEQAEGFCYALRSQAAILADGTVVPCCLDSEGLIPLGNIFESSLDEILSSQRAEDIRQGFARGEAVEELCKRCTYRRRFKLRK